MEREKEGEKGGVKGEKEGEGREKDPYFKGEYNYEVGTQSSVLINPRCPYFRESFKKILQSPCWKLSKLYLSDQVRSLLPPARSDQVRSLLPPS